MTKAFRPILVASIVALHAAVTLYGPCLHGTSGWGHGPGLGGAFAAFHGESGADRSGHASSDHCPVCHAIGLSPWLPEAPAPRPALVDVAAVVLAVSVAAPSSDHPPRSPRAPPALVA